MTKLTVNEDTPSEAIVRRSTAPVEVTDVLGRKLKVRRIRALERYDISRILGADGATNPQVAGPAALAYSVIEIDDEAVATPKTEREFRALIMRLDDEGMEAVAQAHRDHFGVGEETDSGELTP